MMFIYSSEYWRALAIRGQLRRPPHGRELFVPLPWSFIAVDSVLQCIGLDSIGPLMTQDNPSLVNTVAGKWNELSLCVRGSAL